ncbi:MAG TPA: fused MFS/spermidine synthase [Myxococcaceae bacterium]|nr:fused MFS/spermidine synthase [Myxococcaceae bacterium]
MISIFLFVSGATGLTYELVWSRHLGNLLGNSGEAHAVVLATFMGGLALGAWALGGAADRTARPLRLYGMLELATAAYALAFPAVLGGLGALYAGAAPSLGVGAKVAARVAVSAVALLPPTVLMGGTLPAMVRHFSADLAAARREVARLYAVNSLGASAGAFVAGVGLVPAVGLLRAGWAAAALNAALGVGAVWLGRRPVGPVQEDGSAADAALEPGAATRAGGREAGSGSAVEREVIAALAGAALSGFTAMLYELGWIRVLSIVLGASAYAFTLILTAFILGIALGSFWLASRRWSVPPLRAFAWMQAGLAASACLAGPVAVRLPYWFYRAQAGMVRSLDTWPWYQALTFACCLGVLVVPAFFLGASFPAAAQVAGRRLDRIGRQLGTTYLWNTAGAIAGALLGGLALLPWIGLERCFGLGVVCNAVAVVLALWPSGRRAWVAALPGLALVAAGLARDGWGTALANGSTLRMRGAPPASFAAYRELMERGAEVRFRADDTFATVLVAEAPAGAGGPPHRMMKINGKVDATNGADVETQVLAAHLGVLLHPREVERALVIGAGAAITAGSVLAHPVRRLDLVEISPAVLQAARLFAEDNRRALDDPRTRVHVDDAKTFLAGTRAAADRYDLVVSVPSNPWVSGVSGLFTREFFRAVAANLSEDGVLVQWIHTYESDEPLLRLVMRTMRETFPYATTWVGPQDLVMVASRKPMRVDFEALAARMARPEVREDLARVGIRDPFGLLAKQVHSDEAQRAFAGEGPLNTDDLNLLEYASPVAFFLRRDFVPVRDERRAPGGGARLWLSSYLAGRAPAAAELEGLYGNASRYHPPDDPWVRSVAEAWRAAAPESVAAAAAVSRAALAQRDAVAALEAAGRVERGDRTPELVAAYARAAAQVAWNRRSVVMAQAAPIDLALRAAREVPPGHTEVEEAVRELCKALPEGACAGPNPRNEVILVPSSH